jgi:hypothetical protein
MACLVCRGESTVTGFLAEYADDLGAVGTQDDNGHAEAEMLEILADAEEIRRKRVVHQELVDLGFYLRCGSCSIIDQAGAVADLGVENLAGGKCFVRLNEIENLVGHLVVRSPGHILVAISNCARDDIGLLLEDLGAVYGKRCTGF